MFRGYIDVWRIVDGHVVGRVTKHPQIPNGALIQTSPIVRADMEGSIVETSTGSIYILQTPAQGQGQAQAAL